MAYRAKAKTIVQAVTRSENNGTSLAGLFFTSEANRGTKLHDRLMYVAIAESTQDCREMIMTKIAIMRYGSVRKAVMMDGYAISR